ncbi:hypothetical protein Tco_1033227 [Tanacetum coccineum]|uniref:Uncharacterized protein n=1 Tax=Tanacetum coccineum TaxID=301880 RepID=A0ABQ5GEN7_9ASTR
MSDSEHSTVSYTSISSDSDPSAWGIPLMDVDEVPEMDPYEEVAQQGQEAPPSPASAPDPIELEDRVLVYVPELAYPEYLAPSDDEIPIEDQPLPNDASHVALSLGYMADFDPEEDPIKYVADDDDEDDDDEEEEHLAPVDSTDVASPAATPPPPPPAYRTTARMSIQAQAPIPFLSKAEEPLDYRAAGIRLRVASSLPLPAPSTSRRADIPEADILPWKRLLLTAPTPRFEVGESSAAAASRQQGSTMARGVDYIFTDTVYASVRASERRTMAAIKMVNLRVSYQAQRQDVNDHATRVMMRIQVLEARARINTLEDTGSSA